MSQTYRSTTVRTLIATTSERVATLILSFLYAASATNEAFEWSLILEMLTAAALKIEGTLSLALVQNVDVINRLARCVAQLADGKINTDERARKGLVYCVLQRVAVALLVEEQLLKSFLTTDSPSVALFACQTLTRKLSEAVRWVIGDLAHNVSGVQPRTQSPPESADARLAPRVARLWATASAPMLNTRAPRTEPLTEPQTTPQSVVTTLSKNVALTGAPTAQLSADYFSSGQKEANEVKQVREPRKMPKGSPFEGLVFVPRAQS